MRAKVLLIGMVTLFAVSSILVSSGYAETDIRDQVDGRDHRQPGVKQATKGPLTVPDVFGMPGHLVKGSLQVLDLIFG